MRRAHLEIPGIGQLLAQHGETDAIGGRQRLGRKTAAGPRVLIQHVEHAGSPGILQ
jgi:hypothetical protein